MNETEPKPNIGVIGLGQMGYPMAENLLEASYPLHVYNRNPEAAGLTSNANKDRDL